MNIQPVWYEDGKVKIIDQTLLPEQYEVKTLHTPEEMHAAIRTLAVRGAPAIGVAAAYGVWLGLAGRTFGSRGAFLQAVEHTAAYLDTSRPTAVNLFWATARMRDAARGLRWESDAQAAAAMLAEADAVLAGDVQSCRSIGLYGADLLRGSKAVLTHCNAGGLATSGYGTALAPIYVLQEQGAAPRMYADETRPLLQGSRLTAWELARQGVDVTVLCDNMAAVLLRDGMVDAVIVGADRIAANGDAANKIGSYGLSVLARAHGVPFYVAAPFSTVDFACASGRDIPIEERDGDEVRRCGGRQTAPEGVKVFNPAFDVIPAGNIAAIITEKGVVQPPSEAALRRTMQEGALRV